MANTGLAGEGKYIGQEFKVHFCLLLGTGDTSITHVGFKDTSRLMMQVFRGESSIIHYA